MLPGALLVRSTTTDSFQKPETFSSIGWSHAIASSGGLGPLRVANHASAPYGQSHHAFTSQSLTQCKALVAAHQHVDAQ